MAVPRINIKNIDYFKYKKLVIDGVRDDYNVCSKEVKCLCDCVQTLKFRDEEFDDISDRDRFTEICTYYHQILQSKRIEPLDMRIKSAWWGDHKNAYSAGKLKPAVFKEVLAKKAKQWTDRNGGMLEKLSEAQMQSKMDAPGLFVLKHKEHQCFQYVGRAERVFAKVAEKLKAAFEGTIEEPLAALLVISMASDWDFYFIPTAANDDERVLRILENDLILKHDTIWPHGLNFRLHIDSLLEVSEFRKSCLRHDWPPDSDAVDGAEIDLKKLRQQIATQPSTPIEETPPSTPKHTKSKAKAKENIAPAPVPAQVSVSAPASPPEGFWFEPIGTDSPTEEQPPRPGSAGSNATYVVTAPISPVYTDITLVKSPPPIQKPIAMHPTPPRPTSAGRKPVRKEPSKSAERPTSAKSTSRPTSARDRPTTPRRTKQGQVQPKKKRASRSPAPGNGAAWEDDDDPGSVSQDESTGSIDRSPSSASLSSVEGRGPMSPEHGPRKSPGIPRSSKQASRPNTLFKGKPDKSRLPTSAVRHSSRF